MITLSQYYGKFKPEHEANAKVLLSKVSELLSRIGVNKVTITSGFRPPEYNKQIGGSPNSSHCFAQAVDIYDPDKSIGLACVANVEAMKEIGLYMESLTATHKDPKRCWVHLTTRRPSSGNIIFNP